jgi:hypothetical protein
MKSIALVALVTLSLAGAGEAMAGGKGCGYYGCGGGYYHGRPYYPYGGYYYGYPQHKNNNNSNSSVAYAIGGLALGAILMNAYSQNRAPSYTQQSYQAPPAPQGRHLVRDLNGKCYERTVDASGNELRTELPPSACNW